MFIPLRPVPTMPASFSPFSRSPLIYSSCQPVSQSVSHSVCLPFCRFSSVPVTQRHVLAHAHTHRKTNRHSERHCRRSRGGTLRMISFPNFSPFRKIMSLGNVFCGRTLTWSGTFSKEYGVGTHCNGDIVQSSSV